VSWMGKWMGNGECRWLSLARPTPMPA
jgi:hypothetical protein